MENSETMLPARLLRLLQLSDSFFPVGAFAYSDGLESAVLHGSITDTSSLSRWMLHYVENVFVPIEGLALMRCMQAMRQNDTACLARIDEELTALKPSAAARAASASMGRSALSAYRGICQDDRFPAFAALLPRHNAPAAYGLIFWHARASERDALLAFGYTRLAGMVSAGLRLISMGQQKGQELLSGMLDRLPAAVEQVLGMGEEPLRAFSPLLDVQQMNHRYLYSRMFRS